MRKELGKFMVVASSKHYAKLCNFAWSDQPEALERVDERSTRPMDVTRTAYNCTIFALKIIPFPTKTFIGRSGIAALVFSREREQVELISERRLTL